MNRDEFRNAIANACDIMRRAGQGRSHLPLLEHHPLLAETEARV